MKICVYLKLLMCHLSLVLKVLLQNSCKCHKVLLFLFCAETLEREMERVQTAASQMCSHHVPGLMPQLQAKGVVQAVKAVCTLMGNVETQDITEAVEGFMSVCLQFIPAPLPVITLFSVLSVVVFTCIYRISRPIRHTFFTEKCYLCSTCVLCAEGKYYFHTYKYQYLHRVKTTMKMILVAVTMIFWVSMMNKLYYGC